MYYGHLHYGHDGHCPLCGPVSLADEQDPVLVASNHQLYINLIETVFNGDLHGIDVPTAVEEAKSLMSKVFEGFGGDFSTLRLGTPQYDQLRHLEQHIYQFSGCKNYHQGRALQDALISSGKVLLYPEWKKEASTLLASSWQGNWRQAEHVTALQGSFNNARWVDIRQHPETLLRFEVASVERACPICMHYNGLVLPATHPFIKNCGGPLHFRCSCGWHRINEGDITPDSDLPSIEPIPKMFRTNLGEKGLIYPKDHVYFNDIPKDIKKQIMGIVPKRNAGSA